MLALLLTTAWTCVISLSDMTQEEQVRTGVSSLPAQKREALDAWLQNHCKCEEKENRSDLYLSQNIDNGKQLILSDGSRYEIAPDDVDSSALWITPFPIEITRDDSGDYPFIIKNKNSGTEVHARRIKTK